MKQLLYFYIFKLSDPTYSCKCSQSFIIVDNRTLIWITKIWKVVLFWSNSSNLIVDTFLWIGYFQSETGDYEHMSNYNPCLTRNHYSIGPIYLKLHLKFNPIVRVRQLDSVVREGWKIVDHFKVDRQFWLRFV